MGLMHTQPVAQNTGILGISSIPKKDGPARICLVLLYFFVFFGSSYLNPTTINQDKLCNIFLIFCDTLPYTVVYLKKGVSGDLRGKKLEEVIDT